MMLSRSELTMRSLLRCAASVIRVSKAASWVFKAGSSVAARNRDKACCEKRRRKNAQRSLSNAGSRNSSAWLSPGPVAPRTPWAICCIDAQRSRRRSKRCCEAGLSPLNIAPSVLRLFCDPRGVSLGLAFFSACLLASMAERNRGIEVRPARYASSPAATRGNRISGDGLMTAATVTPANANRFQRKKNASLR